MEASPRIYFERTHASDNYRYIYIYIYIYIRVMYDALDQAT